MKIIESGKSTLPSFSFAIKELAEYYCPPLKYMKVSKDDYIKVKSELELVLDKVRNNSFKLLLKAPLRQSCDSFRTGVHSQSCDMYKSNIGNALKSSRICKLKISNLKSRYIFPRIRNSLSWNQCYENPTKSFNLKKNLKTNKEQSALLSNVNYRTVLERIYISKKFKNKYKGRSQDYFRNKYNLSNRQTMD